MAEQTARNFPTAEIAKTISIERMVRFLNILCTEEGVKLCVYLPTI